MRKILTAVSILFCTAFLLSATISAQKTKFKKMKWETELCEMEGTYDSAKYTEAQLRNTHGLMYSLYSIPLSTNNTVFKFEDIGQLSFEKLDSEYKQRIENLKNLDIVKDDYWERMRQKQIRVTERFYQLSRLTIQGYTNPKILLEAENVETCREKYAEPLANGGSPLLKAWAELNTEMKTRNGDPERLQKEFEMQSASPDKFKFALVRVTTFGWWNCVNNTIDYVSSDEPARENFDRLFKKVKTIYCDEP